MNNKILFAIGVGLMFVTSSFSQNKLQNTVILYNVVPLRVDLNTDGSIKNVYGEDVNYLKGYTLVRRQKQEGQTQYADAGQFERVSSEDYDLRFKSNTALLTQEIVNALDNAAESSFFNKHRILINVYATPTDNKSKTLLKNRLNACLAYLEIKGVKKDNIIINAEALLTEDEIIKLTFVK